MASLPERLAALPGPAERIQWLIRHRLLGPAELLAERGLIPATLLPLARAVLAERPVVPVAQIEEERRVFHGLVEAGLRMLPLKGALLAYSCYPAPNQRWRSDLDVLVDPAQLAAARVALTSLGYRPVWSVPGGTPVEQEPWMARHPSGAWSVDLHWANRNHPVLRDRLSFEEQWAASVEMPGLGPGVQGQCPVHALLNAAMHWYDNLYDEPRPLGWLLDIDLLWVQLDEAAVNELLRLAADRQLSGLLAGVLRQTVALLNTPVPSDVLNSLEAEGADQRPTRLIALSGHPLRAYLFSLSCEPGPRRKLRRLRSTFFPPAQHMRERYGVDRPVALIGAYWRRMRSRLGKRSP
ncbi:nucleotidyltransferase family protein [Wenzhouxiangella marina]|uniref:Uncharacterized protein n=1 Tax=Wenzhouxiangella marina TaxID=1579979 RepID=A0A0K0XYP5_9GAMM|nr:nucleotidyltransferase family protein [Wenzhouxiangella marina]AKS42746.1 hypothetical protein WM2015_2384 [Wenzhouxiangella marina]MBB6087578.1 hypothetical protein [Wenzhouxiangella marina]